MLVKKKFELDYFIFKCILTLLVFSAVTGFMLKNSIRSIHESFKAFKLKRTK